LATIISVSTYSVFLVLGNDYDIPGDDNL